jgi:hypothetical protein
MCAGMGSTFWSERADKILKRADVRGQAVGPWHRRLLAQSGHPDRFGESDMGECVVYPKRTSAMRFP